MASTAAESEDGLIQPRVVDEVMGYDHRAVPNLPLEALLFRKVRNVWPWIAVIFALVMIPELIVYSLRGHFAQLDIEAGLFVWVRELIWYDFFQAILIGMLVVGTEGIRRGFACNLRKLNPVLSSPVIPEHEMYLKRWPRLIAGVLGPVAIVPATVYTVSAAGDAYVQYDVMVTRLTVLMFLAGTCLFDLIAMSRRFSQIIEARLKVNLLDLTPLEPITKFASRTALFLMVTIALVFPMMIGSTDLQTVVIILIIVLCTVAVLLMPTSAARRKIKAAKQAEEARVAPQIERILAGLDRHAHDPDSLRDQVALAGLLNWRREVRETREWVFDFDAALRFLLILMVPIGGWVGSEIAEEIIDRLVGG